MVRVDRSNHTNNSNNHSDTSSETSPTSSSRLAGKGLPGGKQQQGTSSEVAVTPSGDSSPAQLAMMTSSSSAAPTTSSNNQYAIPLDENDHRYVGLLNQPRPSSLNSLIQSLYMTPEFRNAMFELEYIQPLKEQRKKAEQSIPCQLQKLFLLLETTENDSLETKDLTQSFGWTSNEAYDQYDVQELCRLMFDALEHKWKGTKHEKLIQDLYRGTMEDFVACLNCGRESVKTDYFLDLPLAVKPFGAIHAYKSVEEALDAFLQREYLCGSNQYFCHQCKTRQDALKGLRITQFPYLLTIQLKRFDFDYNTMHRIKHNDKMTFPDVLDLNEYVNKREPPPRVHPATPQSAWGKPIGRDQERNEDVHMELGSPNPKRYTPGTQSPSREVCVGQAIDHEAVENIIKTHGDNVYELFSVMVHSGNAAGGHYFAYIKNLDKDKWYVFNDTLVDFAFPSDIEKSFGGYPSAWNQSNTNGYMLTYRKIDPKRNASFILSNQLPRHLKSQRLRQTGNSSPPSQPQQPQHRKKFRNEELIQVIDILMDMIKNKKRIYLGSENFWNEIQVQIGSENPGSSWRQFFKRIEQKIPKIAIPDTKKEDLVTILKDYKRSGGLQIIDGNLQ